MMGSRAPSLASSAQRSRPEFGPLSGPRSCPPSLIDTQWFGPGLCSVERRAPDEHTAATECDRVEHGDEYARNMDGTCDAAGFQRRGDAAVNRWDGDVPRAELEQVAQAD